MQAFTAALLISASYGYNFPLRWHKPHGHAVQQHMQRFHMLGPVSSASSDKERRERLGQLIGEDSANRIVPLSAREKAENIEVQMLSNGLQKLDWGETRMVDVEMAPGPLEISLQPILSFSELLAVRLDMPLGLLLEEGDVAAGSSSEDTDATPKLRATPAVVVADLLEGSAEDGGVRRGDLVRATTAISMAMSYPAWQLLMGGVGRPTLQKIILPTLGQPFDAVLAAITSNSREQQGNGQVILLLERAHADEVAEDVAAEAAREGADQAAEEKG